MSTWMLLTLLASCLVAGAAVAVEETARLLRRPGRWGWIAAMAAAVGLPLLFRFVPAAPDPAPQAAGLDGDLLAALLARASEAESAAGALERVVDAALSDSLLLGLWLVLTGGMTLALLLTWHRLRRVRASAARVEIAGLPALLTSATGPLVVGVRRPEIVVPRWIDTLSDEERRLVLRHEWEHVRAGDPLLLLLSAALLAAMPWNLPLWWMRRRLRQALEVDCDARVLAAGADRRAYGAMLIQTAGRPGPTPLLAPALVELPSLLERRIIAMTRKLPVHRRTRLAAAGGVGIVLFAVACELTPRGGSPSPTEPTLADVVESGNPQESRHMIIEFAADDSLKAAAVGARISPTGEVSIAHVGPDGDTVWSSPMKVRRSALDVVSANGAKPIYIVDGERVASVEGLDPDRILEVDVMKGPVAIERFGPEGENGVVQITTGDPSAGSPRRVRRIESSQSAEAHADMEIVHDSVALRIQKHGPGGVVTAFGFGTLENPNAKPLILVEGKKVDSLEGIDPTTIQKIEVIKDRSATATYGPGSENGVILITLKK